MYLGHLIHKGDCNKCEGDDDADTNNDVAERYDNDVGMREKERKK